MSDRFFKSSAGSGYPESVQKIGGVSGNPSVKKNDLKIMSALKNGKICVDLGSIFLVSQSVSQTF